VTTALLHGSCPDCLILCADASYEEVFTSVPRPDVAHIARLYEEVAALVKPAPVVAVSVNTRGLDESAAEKLLERVTAETGLPAADPVRHPATPILDAVLQAPKTQATGS
ncbi:MAG: NAD-dependent epimerase/dehydratase family protein, partial [Actinomycetota bacterium]|nr:NAD-dependent epimerase/dehydratase family protein [Actinomycetota bacterium]